jgi:hypothetical protein
VSVGDANEVDILLDELRVLKQRQDKTEKE